MCESRNDSAKQSAEEVNKKVFDNKTTRTNAQFVVEATDQCFGALEIAKLGQARARHANVKAMATQITEGLNFLIQEFQNYGAAQSVSTPLSGPEKTTDEVKELSEIENHAFDEAWRNQMLEFTRKMIQDFEQHKLEDKNRREDSGTAPLVVLVDEALSTLRTHEALLSGNERSTVTTVGAR